MSRRRVESLERRLSASQWRAGFPLVEERSPQEILGINSLKDGLVEINDEVDETRFDLAGALREVNAYNAEIHGW